MLALNQMLNLDFGVWGVEAPLTVTGGHKISLALQSCVGRTHFMSQSNRKHSPVISDSQWTLVPPPSRHLGDHCSLMLWLSWARVCSVQFSSTVVSDSLWPHESQHARPPCPSPSPRVHSNSGPSSQWCHPAISSSVVPFSSFPQSLPASESFPMSQFFTWGGQSIGVSASASVLLCLPSNIILFFPRTVTIPCHSANNETESVQVSGSLVKKSAEFERSAQQAPKRLTSPLSKRGGNNDDNLFYCAGERRKKMKCSFSKIRQAWLVDFDSKITILIYPTNAN